MNEWMLKWMLIKIGFFKDCFRKLIYENRGMQNQIKRDECIDKWINMKDENWIFGILTVIINVH